MKLKHGPCHNVFNCTICILIFLTVPVIAHWTSTITQEDIKLVKMWVKLAINGYAEPLPVHQPNKRAWYQFWEY